LNTENGEIPVNKSSVETILYDDPEQSYYQLGKDLQRVGRMKEALKAYQKALEHRPGFQAAREAIFQVERLLEQQEEHRLTEEIQQKRAIMAQAGLSAAPDTAQAGREQAGHALPLAVEQTALPGQTINQRFGFGFAVYKPLPSGEAWVSVTEVRPQGPAALGGLERGDIIVAIWGESIRYLSPEQILEQIDQGGRELALTIERAVTVRPRGNQEQPDWGLEMELTYDGLRIVSVIDQGAAQGRLAVGDLLVEIHGRSTRYMPLSEATSLMELKPSELEVSIQRLIVMREAV
jgi:tetratricopeptide (TPR) repeat protein